MVQARVSSDDGIQVELGRRRFLFDPSGKRHKLELGGPVIPRFQAGASL